MLALDTSVAIAGIAAWHEDHGRGREALARQPRIPAQALVETYSVLTRLPDSYRVSPAVAWKIIERWFPAQPLVLDATGHRDALRAMASAGVSGGATYDGLIALTAKAANARIVTLDRRAAATYLRCGVEYELLG